MSLKAAVELAAKSPGCFGPMSCNFFVGNVGKSLDIPYFRNVLVTSHPDHFLANNMYNFISRAVKSRGSGWIEVAPCTAQALADRGDFVVAVAQSLDPSDHGHIAIVVPYSWNRWRYGVFVDGRSEQRDEPGTGPWVRDGEIAKKDESRRAGWQFNKTRNSKPIYAFWNNYMETCSPDLICESSGGLYTDPRSAASCQGAP
jgi:hypothetical protein